GSASLDWKSTPCPLCQWGLINNPYSVAGIPPLSVGIHPRRRPCLIPDRRASFVKPKNANPLSSIGFDFFFSRN
ncbi:MAG: hypothetical protein J4F48_12425, partial [Nitrospinae bacterium]|nr:hypothetical protein [Nitrospinota bacterium]